MTVWVFLAYIWFNQICLEILFKARSSVKYGRNYYFIFRVFLTGIYRHLWQLCCTYLICDFLRLNALFKFTLVFGQGAENSGFVLILNKPRDFGKIALAGHIKIFDRILRAQCALVQEIMEISVKPVDKSTVNMPLFPTINKFNHICGCNTITFFKNQNRR